MKFSIVSLMTVVSITAWCLALYNTPAAFRGTFIAVSMLAIICALFAIAMTSPVGEKGNIEAEKNWLLQAFEPTFKTAGIAFVAVVLVSIIMLLLAVAFVIGHFVTGT